MKKMILMFVMTVIAFSGCEPMQNGGAVDKAYNVGKTLYKAGKTAVPGLPLDEDTRKTLKEIDTYATMYDGARTVVRGALDDEKKSTVDGNSTKLTESSSSLSAGSDKNTTKEIK